MRSSITHPVQKSALQYLCPTIEFAVNDVPAEGIAQYAVSDGFEGKRGYKRKISDPLPELVIHLTKLLFSIEGDQRENAVTSVVSILESAAFDKDVFSSYVKDVVKCDKICQKLVEIHIATAALETVV